MSMTLGEFMQKRRKELGLTQQELADRLGWTDTGRVSRAEQGHSFRTFPKPDDLRNLARVLETTPESMLAALGYLDEAEVARDRTPDQIFTMLADELRMTPDLNPEVREAGIDLLRHLKRLQDGIGGPVGE